MDPLLFKEINWPDIYFHKKQKEVIYSAIENDETFVMGSNESGKSLLSAFVAVYWICTKEHGRVVVTSVKLDQLRDVIWGEITRLINTSKTNLPLQCNFLHIKRLDNTGKPIPSAELVGQVSNTQEGILGRHASEGWGVDNITHGPLTLVIGEESSGIADHVRNSTLTWADRRLWISNTWNCENFFREATDEDYVNEKGIKGGEDIPRESGGYHRKVIRIDSLDNPNIAYGMEEEKRGLTPSNRVFIPGIKTYSKFKEDLILLDSMMVEVVLWAKYYKGKELKLYPNDWIERATRLYKLHRGKKRKAKAIGIDPGEGVSKTSLCAIDEYGVIEIESVLTPDTSDITSMIIAFARKHKVPSQCWGIDRGGGGKQIADSLRRMGYNIRTIAFGQSIQEDPKPGMSSYTPHRERVDHIETKYAYTSFRAMIYGNFSEQLDPGGKPTIEELENLNPEFITPDMGFSIPPQYHILFQEMRSIPKVRDDNGRLWIPPKGNKDLPDWVPKKSKKTLIQLVGHSPDELDSVVVALYMMNNPLVKKKVGAPV